MSETGMYVAAHLAFARGATPARNSNAEPAVPRGYRGDKMPVPIRNIELINPRGFWP